MNEPLWTKAEVAAATGGARHRRDWRRPASRSTAARSRPGDLFVALAGPNHDGHDYVAAALAKGGAAAFVHRVPGDVSADAPADHRRRHHGRAATISPRAARARSGARILAVTGSVGKTGTKEMLKLSLGAAGPAYASAGNLNNQWGAPLVPRPPAARGALRRVRARHESRGRDRAPVAPGAAPLAVITTVEAVHLEFFASTARDRRAKAEIFAGMDADGTAILPRDNRHYDQLAAAARAAGVTRIESFGRHIDAGARLLDAAVDPDATLVFALIGDNPVGYRVGAPGLHWASEQPGRGAGRARRRSRSTSRPRRWRR